MNFRVSDEDFYMRRRLLTIGIIMIMAMAALSVGVYAGTFTSYAKWNNKTKYHQERFSNCLIVDGIDVSEYQNDKGSINWVAAKANGVDYAIIRVGWRGYGSKGSLHEDKYFRTNIAGAKAAGIMVGVYMFSQATNASEAAEEATKAMDILASAGYGPEDLDLPIYMDWEYAGAGDGGRMYTYGIGDKATSTATANAFANACISRGYKPGLYANLSFLNNHINYSSLNSNIRLWVAQYNNENEYTNGYFDIWQYGSDGSVSGLSGRIDLDFWYIKKDGEGSSINNCEVMIGTNGYYQYQNAAVAHKPDVQVTIGDTVLTNGTDYKVGYIANTARGTAYAYIYGIGNYSGYKLVPFTITDNMPVEEVELTAFADDDLTSKSVDINADDSGYITKVGLGVKTSELKAQLATKEGYSIKIKNLRGEEINDDTLVGTRAVVEVYNANNELQGSMRVVVKGDINGDGQVTASDSMATLRKIAGTYSPTDSQSKAMDANKDGNITASDVMMMLRHIAGTYTITE